jgi:acyl-[acyl-carrier-protein]-phospholipid O-acyltransferase/long-chain-fatty-acid--[acyl-carrier-protein] ligase
MPILRNKWAPLFISNFLGVYNDNFLKNCIIFIAVTWSLPRWLDQSQLISMVSAALIVPYLFLSPLAGRLAVIYSKKKVFRICKLLEIPVLIVACTAFYFHWVMLAVFTVLVMGILSCLYSPSKYSLIRDIGGHEGVSFGSGVFEAMAFLGILIGTVTASIVSDHYNQWLMFGLILGLAVLGYIVTHSIRAEELPENKEDVSTINPVKFIITSYKFARQHKDVNSAVFGASAFWLIGGMLQMNLVIHTEHFYHSSNSVTGMIMACAAIGIAFGTWAAGKISGKEVKRGLIMIGILGMSLLFAILTFIQLNFWLYAICIFATAFMGGLFQIPCLSMLQNANLGRKLGDMIGYLNLITFIFVLFGTLLFSITTHFTSDNTFGVFGILLIICLSVSLYFFRKSPDYLNETISMFRKSANNLPS